MIQSINDPSRHNRILNIGGPDGAITKKMQGEMMFKSLGKEESFSSAPLWLFDAFINIFQFLANVFRLESVSNVAETARICKYYVVEDMVTTDPSEKYGTDTLQEYYDRIAVEGQAYDPYTTMLVTPKKKLERVVMNLRSEANAVE